MRWRDTYDLRLNEFAIVDYMPGSPQTQHIWFDNILITTDFPGSAVGGTTFVDVPEDHVFSAPIEWLAGAGITRGCNPPLNTRFCPDNPVTRGQMAAFLSRALPLPAGSGDPFTDDALPEAILTLRQGFGRLIRTREDRGVVAVLDPRVRTRAYGAAFLESLPPCPRTDSIEEVARFLSTSTDPS